MMRNPQQTIGNMVDKSNMTLISYIDREGYPVTKAMLKPRKREGIKTFWFTTNTSSNKVKAFRENPKASIYIVDKKFFRGVTDPDYCVLKFTAAKGRYYSSFKSEDFDI